MQKRKDKKRQKDDYEEKEVEKATKEELKVAKWMRSNVPIKKTKFLNHNVEYFSSGKALDALMNSKFAQGDNCLFPHRQAAIDFLDGMLAHKVFHRAKKVPVSEHELKGRTSKKSKDDGKEKSDKKPEEKQTDAESSHAENKSEKQLAEKEKRKRKIRLDMHPDQIFVDGHEAYVWIYDPIPMHYWILGVLVVIGAIVICLFPLWPPSLRKGVYYLSIAAAGFLVFILGLAVLRAIVFAFIWIVTGGKHHFWIFPNLTEDVGFLASFQPLYQHEYKGDSTNSNKDKKSKKRKKDKDSDAEEEVTTEKTPLLEQDEDEALETEQDSPKRDEKRSGDSPSESESESSQKSSTGKDFEFIDDNEAKEAES
ncbi:translocation protein SEC62 [Culicoides brevitarsis]|uniref:translocation protein SEC62 n=1 Tax=Culicoides brevitarsis TaxID=469753 RepID=UPI00307B4C9A